MPFRATVPHRGSKVTRTFQTSQKYDFTCLHYFLIWKVLTASVSCETLSTRILFWNELWSTVPLLLATMKNLGWRCWVFKEIHGSWIGYINWLATENTIQNRINYEVEIPHVLAPYGSNLHQFHLFPQQPQVPGPPKAHLSHSCWTHHVRNNDYFTHRVADSKIKFLTLSTRQYRLSSLVLTVQSKWTSTETSDDLCGEPNNTFSLLLQAETMSNSNN